MDARWTDPGTQRSYGAVEPRDLNTWDAYPCQVRKVFDEDRRWGLLIFPKRDSVHYALVDVS
jgi:hypothetical protein